MSEDDLLGGGSREPLRSCCVKLAGRLWATCQHAPDFQDGLKELQVGRDGGGARAGAGHCSRGIGTIGHHADAAWWACNSRVA